MLGDRIAALRKSQGLSQAELARRLQISSSAMGMYEQGRREPSLQMVVSLAQTLGVSTDYLLTGKPAVPKDSQAWAASISAAAGRANARRETFTREELAALFAAFLAEP